MRFFANLLWFLSTLPDYVLFRIALFFPATAQRRKAQYQSEVILYEPTSGTTSGTKWIPYTKELHREFLRGINPWIFSLYLRHPKLFFLSHYWSISPAAKVTPPTELEGKGGFNDDRDYLNPLQRFVSGAIFPVPGSVGKIENEMEHARQTLAALLADRNLGLISVWHPSFLRILLEKAPLFCKEITDEPRRTEVCKFLEQKEYTKIWPHLQLISCWDQARAAGEADVLRKLFPGVEVQGKGLLATEGIVTIPWSKGRKVAAVRSHTLWFKEFENEGDFIPLDGVKKNVRYLVFLSTGNGSDHYSLGDVVLCTGFVHRTPCFDFLYRAGVSDLCGEKLHECHAEHVISVLEKSYGKFLFAMFTPSQARDGYLFLYESENEVPPEIPESLLCENYYYHDARCKGQLKPLMCKKIRNGMKWYRSQSGASAGAVKNPALQMIAFQK